MYGSETYNSGVLIRRLTVVERFQFREEALDVFVEFVVSDISYVTFLRLMYQSSIPDATNIYLGTKYRFRCDKTGILLLFWKYVFLFSLEL
jgi:hypothetical protein